MMSSKLQYTLVTITLPVAAACGWGWGWGWGCEGWGCEGWGCEGWDCGGWEWEGGGGRMKVASKVDGGCWAAERNEHSQSYPRIHPTVSLNTVSPGAPAVEGAICEELMMQ